MQMVSMGEIADGVIQGMGWEAEAYTLSGRDRKTLKNAVNNALARLYSEHKWPTLRRVELRTYRPPWDAAETYAAGDEVWLADAAADGGGDYWRATAASTGTAPADGSLVWGRVTDGDPLTKFVQLAQPWEAWAMDEGGVDLDFFAFDKDPRLNPRLKPIAGCDFWMESVTLPPDAPKRVWVMFVPQRPHADFTEWVAGTAYAAGDYCYRTLTGNTYAALRDSTGAVPEESPLDWTEIGVPEIFANYLTLCGEAAWRKEDDGRARAQAEAETELERLAGACIDRAGVRQGGWQAGR